MIRLRTPILCLALPLGVALAALAAAADPKPGDKPAPKAHAKLIDVESVTNTPWKVTVALDHADHNYSVGDEIVIKVTSEEDGYLYLFDLRAGSDPVCIFPNADQNKNDIQAKQEITIPNPDNKTFRLRAKAADTTETLLAVVFKDVPGDIRVQDYIDSKGVKSVSKIQLKRLIVQAGMGGTAAQVDPAQQDAPITVQKEKDKVQQQNQDQFQQKMKRWATGTTDIVITDAVPSKDKVPTKDKVPAKDK